MAHLHVPSGIALLESALGERTGEALRRLDLSDLLLRSRTDGIDRVTLAAALNIALFEDLLQRVPSGAAYVREQQTAGTRIVFDHGALRTVLFPSGPTGALPGGEKAFARLLGPLGYQVNGVYPLPRLKMTGRAWASIDLPESIPQFFVSELHVDQFSEAFVAAAQRVFGTSRDPVRASTLRSLDQLSTTGRLPLDDAKEVLHDLLAAFGCHHELPSVEDYETLLAESAEAAWIATEGNAFNHATDRVADVHALAELEAASGRPIKDRVEVSASGRIHQTAHRAALVRRRLRDGEQVIEREVPGSFYEFITRDQDPQTGGLDLGFDSSNATGIFSMTEASAC